MAEFGNEGMKYLRRIAYEKILQLFMRNVNYDAY